MKQAVRYHLINITRYLTEVASQTLLLSPTMIHLRHLNDEVLCSWRNQIVALAPSAKGHSKCVKSGNLYIFFGSR